MQRLFLLSRKISPKGPRRRAALIAIVVAGTALAQFSLPGFALETDRQQPLEVNADSTDGTLGDGTTILLGDVDIRQGTLRVRAERAEVEKREGKVHRVILTGEPASLEQEIEEQGLVQAFARKIQYEVSSGLVTLTGDADVRHPQYEITGEVLIYDLDAQHFQGSGGDGNGRIRIRLDPEVAPDLAPGFTPGTTNPDAETPEAGESPD